MAVVDSKQLFCSFISINRTRKIYCATHSLCINYMALSNLSKLYLTTLMVMNERVFTSYQNATAAVFLKKELIHWRLLNANNFIYVFYVECWCILTRSISSYRVIKMLQSTEIQKDRRHGRTPSRNYWTTQWDCTYLR